MGSDGGGDGGPLDWWKVLELLIPAVLSLGLAWCLFRAEQKSQRKAAKVGFTTGFYERTYAQMHESVATASQKLTEASGVYRLGRPGRQFIASAGDDVRHSLTLAMAIQSPLKPALRGALDALNGFLDDVDDSQPVLEGDANFYRLNALARTVKTIEMDVLRYITSGDLLRDVETLVERSQAKNVSSESTAGVSDAKSSS